MICKAYSPVKRRCAQMPNGADRKYMEAGHVESE